MKKKTIKHSRKGYAICLKYEKDKPYIFSPDFLKKEVEYQYKKTGLYKPQYTIIPIQISYEI